MVLVMLHEGDVLVRLDGVNRIQFPDTCPVCGRNATSNTRIPFVQQGKMPKSPIPRDRPATKKLIEARQNMASIQIPVCESHDLSYQELGRAKGLMTVMGGISLVALFFLIITIGSSVIAGRGLNYLSVLGLVAVILLMVFSAKLVGPSAVEEAVSLVQYEPQSGIAIIRVKNRAYAERITELNPMRATLGIVKSVKGKV